MNISRSVKERETEGGGGGERSGKTIRQVNSIAGRKEENKREAHVACTDSRRYGELKTERDVFIRDGLQYHERLGLLIPTTISSISPKFTAGTVNRNDQIRALAKKEEENNDN